MKSVVAKTRQRGFSWLVRRVLDEFITPGTLLGRIARRCNAGLLAAGRGIVGRPAKSDDTLYAFYDLAVCPITYDMAWFLAGARARCRRNGLAAVHVVIVPGWAREGGLREEMPDYEQAVGRDARWWRLHNILLPLFGLMAAGTGLTVCESRAAAGRLRNRALHVYPHDYWVSLPTAFEYRDAVADLEWSGLDGISALAHGRVFVEQWLERAGAAGRRVVTITLRRQTFVPARNSNLEAWLNFAGWLDPGEFFPVFVPDTDSSLGELPELNGRAVFRESAFNVFLRTSLYETAYLNMSISNGPSSLFYLNPLCRYLVFGWVVPGAAQASMDLQLSRGFRPGESLCFAKPYQKIVWEMDTFETIKREFVAMSARIDEGLLAVNQGGGARPSSEAVSEC